MNEEIQYQKMQGLSIDRAALLNCIKDNKEKHDLLYEASIQAHKQCVYEYVEKSKDYMKESSKIYNNFAKKVDADFQSWDSKSTYLVKFPEHKDLPTKACPPAFPVSYESEYNAAIKRIELSVHDNFQLDESEFQKFIMNNWSWKTQFLGYCNTMITGSIYNSSVGTGKFLGTTYSGLLQQF